MPDGRRLVSVASGESSAIEDAQAAGCRLFSWLRCGFTQRHLPHGLADRLLDGLPLAAGCRPRSCPRLHPAHGLCGRLSHRLRRRLRSRLRRHWSRLCRHRRRLRCGRGSCDRHGGEIGQKHPDLILRHQGRGGRGRGRRWPRSEDLRCLHGGWRRRDGCGARIGDRDGSGDRRRARRSRDCASG